MYILISYTVYLFRYGVPTFEISDLSIFLKYLKLLIQSYSTIDCNIFKNIYIILHFLKCTLNSDQRSATGPIVYYGIEKDSIC